MGLVLVSKGQEEVGFRVIGVGGQGGHLRYVEVRVRVCLNRFQVMSSLLRSRCATLVGPPALTTLSVWLFVGATPWSLSVA